MDSLRKIVDDAPKIAAYGEDDPAYVAIPRTVVSALLDVAEVAGGPDDYEGTPEGFAFWLADLKAALARLEEVRRDR